MARSGRNLPPRFPMERLNRFAWLLDNSIPIPGTRYRIGLDPLIGLIPGFGDAAGALLSLYIISEAARARLPAPILMRMGFNVALEAIIGTIPLLGDIFDMSWKANIRNTRLIERYDRSSREAVRSSTIGIIVVAAIVAFVLAGAIYLGFLILRRLWAVAAG